MVKSSDPNTGHLGHTERGEHVYAHIEFYRLITNNSFWILRRVSQWLVGVRWVVEHILRKALRKGWSLRDLPRLIMIVPSDIPWNILVSWWWTIIMIHWSTSQIPFWNRYLLTSKQPPTNQLAPVQRGLWLWSNPIASRWTSTSSPTRHQTDWVYAEWSRTGWNLFLEK